VCPAGVPYGQLIEAAKAEIERQRPGPVARRAFRWMNFNLLLGHRRLLALAATALRVYQASGLQTVIRRSGVLRLLPRTARAWEALTPAMPARADRAPLPAVTPAVSPSRGRVAMLTGCVQAVVFGAHNRATARVLARNGYEVLAPTAQGCCGALNAHGGDHARAVDMARALIAVFERTPVDAIIVNTSGCGAHMKNYGALLAGDPAWAERARRFAAVVQDVTEFLARSPLRGPLLPVPLTATYHDPCHVVHGQKIRKQPRELLAQIPGLRLVDLPESDWCCGSAGIYNLTQPDMATRLLRRKVRHVESTHAEVVVTANPGCILQMQAGLRDKGLPVQVLHIVEVLDRAYGSPA
jgi:glycolate oxidase iron-sulfur subunit